ncbi:hypothetical protein CYMTET_43692 [Cymbomonas tetramitiformis]|uniref:Uncharacterized protein n=1 Tax=Cymbomonas tetramitiformis TaxID=36881 RepID=A0AAE0EZR0_9CHLO|nr:hypothetical protein CYMTET_43692 [Cymbomonas tetramitiformis]
MKAVTVVPEEVTASWKCMGYFRASRSSSKLLDEGFAKRARRVKPGRALVNSSLADVASDGGYFIAGAILAYPFARSAAVKIIQQTRPIRCDICDGVGHNTCAMCKGRGRLGNVSSAFDFSMQSIYSDVEFSLVNRSGDVESALIKAGFFAKTVVARG